MLACIALAIWVYLFFLHGFFWRSKPELAAAIPREFPSVDIIVPARNEAETIRAATISLLGQDYSGHYQVVVVDDNSQDETGELAGQAPNLTVLRLDSKPPGWSGKLWALSRGVAATDAPLIFFTDADIVHEPGHLSSLVSHMIHARLGMVSEMVHLNCSSVAEKMLVPAFVYFFQMLYPFSRVNDENCSVAAAAGGSILIRRDTLARIGGIEAIRHALIDDVTLAKAVKPLSGIYLGHSELARSIRPYPVFGDIWQMVARTAFTQLRYSTWLLIVTVLGLTFVWFVPLVAIAAGSGWIRAAGAAACVMAWISYLPTLTRYRCSAAWAFALPMIALFYMAATLGSAVNHWRGIGAQWKSRSYEGRAE